MSHDHAHHHGHEHGYHGHAHGTGHSHAPHTFGRAFAIGIALNLAYVAGEIFYGIAANSLALLADADTTWAMFWDLSRLGSRQS